MLVKKITGLKKNSFLILILIFSSGVTIYYIKNRDDLSKAPIVMRYLSGDNNILCHYIENDDALPPAEDPEFSPRPNSLFFHETSCSGGLNSRQACAVESAARAHPQRQVYVLFSGPISNYMLKKSNLFTLQTIPNIKFARVHITEYSKKTPLEGLIHKNSINRSKWRVEHTSDALRMLTLYKYGGVYLDTDVMVVKPLTALGHNWVAKQDAVNVIVMIFRLEVYGPEYLYPVHDSNFSAYFNPDFLESFDKAFIHHFWNKRSRDHEIRKDSPYAIKAKQYCPTIYEMYGDEFGR